MISRRRTFRGKPRKEKDPINENIMANVVLVIDEDGTRLGEMPRRDAIEMARSRDLDLVCVSAKSQPVVTRIADYGKIKYELKKKSQQARQKRTLVEIKTLKLRPAIHEHDLQWKARDAIKWLQEGNRVRVRVMVIGRQRAMSPEENRKPLFRFLKEIAEYGEQEGDFEQVGTDWQVLVVPLKSKSKEKANG